MKLKALIKCQFVLSFGLLSLAACAAKPHVEIPERLAGRNLSRSFGFPSKFHEAISAAASSVPDPDQFYVEIEEVPGPIYVLHLWHQTAFLQENLGQMGNPGGKCRTIRFDPIRKKVLSNLLWQ